MRIKHLITILAGTLALTLALPMTASATPPPVDENGWIYVPGHYNTAGQWVEPFYRAPEKTGFAWEEPRQLEDGN